MTLQEIFDAGLFSIRGQDYEPSYHSGLQQCMYRGPNGCKCHIGHSIRDKDYDPAMEGETTIVERIYKLFPGISEDALYRFQKIHDDTLRNSSSGVYEKRMQRFANLHKLRYTPVPK